MFADPVSYLWMLSSCDCSITKLYYLIRDGLVLIRSLLKRKYV